MTAPARIRGSSHVNCKEVQLDKQGSEGVRATLPPAPPHSLYILGWQDQGNILRVALIMSLRYFNLMRDFDSAAGPGFSLADLRTGKWSKIPGMNTSKTRIARSERKITQAAGLRTSGSIPPGLYLVLAA